MARKLEPNGSYPSAPEAEAQVLGGLICYPDTLDEVLDILSGGPADFDSANHRAIFRAILALGTHGPGISDTAVITYMRGLGEIDDENDAGPYSAAYVQLLARDARGGPDWTIEYAKAVRDAARRRHDMQLAEKLHDAAQHENESYEATRAAYLDAFTLNASSAADDLELLTASQAEALPPLRGILGDILLDDSIAFLYGPSGRWKSFIALDWALSLATGRVWMGRPVEQGDVLYVCSEGARGIGKRITAWKMHHGIRDADHLYILPMAIDLTQPAQVARLLRRLESADLRPRLVVIDTLAASNSGDENAQQNASIVLMAADRIKRAADGACVLIVHHTGYDATHMRGATGFFNGADIVIRVEGGEANKRLEPGEPVKLVSHKPKNGEPFHDIVLTTTLQTWAAEDGSIHGSLVMIPGDEAASAARAKAKEEGLTPNRRLMLGAIERAGDEGLTRREAVERSGLRSSTGYNVLDWLDANGYIRRGMVGMECKYYCSLVPILSIRGQENDALSSPTRSNDDTRHFGTSEQ